MIQKTGTIKGFLLANKPEGMTSFSVVKKVRSITQVKKVGHAGTLDPFATGLLVLALDRSYTSRLQEVVNTEKTYEVEVLFGVETNTLDCDGEVVKTMAGRLDRSQLESVIDQFHGTQLQTPPAFSAKKINGVRAYHLARKNQEVCLEPVEITISKIELLAFHSNFQSTATLRVVCSKGTYVRQLVSDIARACNTVAHAKRLVRTQIGHYMLKDALPYEALSREAIQAAILNA